MNGEPPVGVVLTVFRGGCGVVFEDRVLDLRLVGRHAATGLALAVGDEITFDPEKRTLLELLPRRTKLSRLRPLRGRRARRGREEQVIAANMNRIAIVASVVKPRFRPGAVDRFLLAAHVGGLEALLVVNKLDLLEGADLPEEVKSFEPAVPLLAVSAKTGAGIEILRERLAESVTVLAGHSGVGKSSLINALEPTLRLDTGGLGRNGRGRHTTSRAILLRLEHNATVVDTPGMREIETGPVDSTILNEVYPDVAELAGRCRFRDCRHESEPSCAVLAAVESGEIARIRHESYRRLERATRD